MRQVIDITQMRRRNLIEVAWDLLSLLNKSQNN